MLTPTTTGLKGALSAASIGELLEALATAREAADGPVLVTGGIGPGGSICRGVDLTALAHESATEKQRRQAETMAAAIKRLVIALLDYPRPLVAAVDGTVVGLSVTLLPYFDLVYASDKAVFRGEWARLGQIPEAFASATLFDGSRGSSGPLREMLLTGRQISAGEAFQAGIVDRVVWPDRVMEEIVPR